MHLISKSKLLVLLLVFLSGVLWAQPQTEREEKIAGYRYEKRLKGPNHQRSQVLEIMVDEYNNYLAVTYRAEKSSFTYLAIYRLYSWEEVLMLRLEDKRLELYNSTFDPGGDYFYVNTDIYRNRFKRIDLKTKNVEDVSCSATPKGCRKIEPLQYKTEAYTLNNNYYIFCPENYRNSVLILKSKALIEAEKAKNPYFLLDEEAEKERLEKEMKMADPEQAPDDQRIVRQIEKEKAKSESEQVKEKRTKVITNYIDIIVDEKTIKDLERYKYAKYAGYEFIINNWLAYTFEYEPNKTKSITISEEDFNTLINTGEVTKDAVRLKLTPKAKP
ncbi:MAG TPA: hypothetical protein PK990_01660 [Salinivirgaceae bacterium]|nr:hypothetical protein [Salinivirgaceae bacterium]